jgi:hypothetical protein
MTVGRLLFAIHVPMPRPLGSPSTASGRHRAQNDSETLFTAIFGVRSFGGREYYIVFVDDCKRWSEVDILREKSEALKAYQKFDATLETQDGVRVKVLATNRG